MGGASLRWRNSMRGRLRGQRFCGACRSEGFVRGEHPPDGLGEFAGEVDPGDPGAALLAQASPGPLVALGVGRGATHGSAPYSAVSAWLPVGLAGAAFNT